MYYQSIQIFSGVVSASSKKAIQKPVYWYLPCKSAQTSTIVLNCDCFLWHGMFPLASVLAEVKAFDN